MQRALIDAQVARFSSEPDPRGRVYFLGFAGVGEERVFAEEIKLAAQRVGEKYGSSTRSVLLLNDRRDLATLAARLGVVIALCARGDCARHEP